MTFNGLPVVATGAGQCERCGRSVERLLVQYTDGRAWVAVDRSDYLLRTGYSTHECGPRDGGEPMRKAA